MSAEAKALILRMQDMVSNWDRFKNLFDGNGHQSLPIRLDRMEGILKKKPWKKGQEAFEEDMEERWKAFLASEAAKERSGAGRFERIVLALGVIASLLIQILGG